jgi:uncharacterized protein (TIGR03437 family)
LAWSTYVMSADHNNVQQGVTHLAVTGAGDAYLAGITGAGFPVTPSAPQTCFDGPIYNAFVAHLDSHGALLDGTYVGQNVFTLDAMTVAGDGSVRIVTNFAGSLASFQVRFGASGSTAPPCLSPSVLNSATMSGIEVLNTPVPGGTSGVVPGELITLTGFGIGPETGVVYKPDVQGGAPRELAGVQVLFDGEPAPLLYAQSRQINTQAPVELSGKTQTSLTVKYNGASFGPLTVPVSDFGAQGIFRLEPGVSSRAAALNQDGTVNGPSNPAPRGSVVSLWATGFGLTDPPCVTGAINPPGAANLVTGLTALLAYSPMQGVPAQTTPAVYAGTAPALLCGVQQVNLTVPDFAPSGVFKFSPWETKKLPAGDSLLVFGSIGATVYVK